MVSQQAALYATAMTVLAQTQIYYAQDARSYPMLVALGLANCLMILRIEHTGIRRKLSMLNTLECLLDRQVQSVLHYFLDRSYGQGRSCNYIGRYRPGFAHHLILGDYVIEKTEALTLLGGEATPGQEHLHCNVMRQLAGKSLHATCIGHDP